MKLINIGNRGYRKYRTEDCRFTAEWVERQGARSNYTVTDTHTSKTLRADTVPEIQEAIREIVIRDQFGDDRQVPQVGDELYACRSVRLLAHENDEPCTWKIETRRITAVRIDGVEFAGLRGRIGWSDVRRNYERTPQDAIATFIAAQRGEIDTAKEKIAEAERAITWAEGLANEAGQPDDPDRR